MVSEAASAKQQLLRALRTAFDVSPAPGGRDAYAINGEVRLVVVYSKGRQVRGYTQYFFGINPNVGSRFDPARDLFVFVCGSAERLFALPVRHVQEFTLDRSTYRLHIDIPDKRPDASYLAEDPDRRSLAKFRHDRMSLTALVSDYLDSLPAERAAGQQPPLHDEPTTPALAAVHDELKGRLVEMGRILGMYAEPEYEIDGFKYDVVWKEREDLGVRKAFEIQHRGSVDSALIKLKHAHDMWRSDLFLIVTGEKDIEKAKKLLAPKLYGAFHEISHTKVVGPETVRELHEAVAKHEQSVRLMLKK